MEVFLDANDLWEAVEEDYEVAPLPANPTVAQMKNHKERKQRKSKAKACLFAAVSSSIFTRIMSLDSAKEIWDFLKQEYEGNEKVKGMQVLNLIREFEMQKMKDSETIKEYCERLLGIVNKVRLLGAKFKDSRVVQKILVTIPERFESTLSSLENTKDVSTITLAELVSALQASEQRRLMRMEGVVEGALQAKVQVNQGSKGKKKKGKKAGCDQEESTINGGETKQSYPPCQHCGKKNHPPFRCWRRPDIRCNKCQQLGHISKFCKNKGQQQQEAKVADQQEEEQLFVATCLSTNHSSESWLIDSGCTNHMTYDKGLFKELVNAESSKVRIGDGSYLAVKGRGTIAIEGCSGTKLVSDVLFVPEINQNLLSVGQLVEKGYKLLFENKMCQIKDSGGQDLF
jgi:hypothetical protein